LQQLDKRFEDHPSLFKINILSQNVKVEIMVPDRSSFNSIGLVPTMFGSTNVASMSMEKFVHSLNPDIKVVSKPREGHEYPYFEGFKEFFRQAP